MKMLSVSAILLGAGESKRMGIDKLSLPWGRKTILEHCFETLLRSEVQEVVVVLGGRSRRMRTLFQGRRRVKIVMNPHAEKGMSTSIRRGLQVIRPDSPGILIALGDQPFLKTRTINALIRAFGQEGEGIVVPSFRGRKGHPVIFHRRYKKELSNLNGDVGGKSILEKHPEDVKVVHSKSAGVVKDVDTWQDYTYVHRAVAEAGRSTTYPPLPSSRQRRAYVQAGASEERVGEDEEGDLDEIEKEDG